MNPLDLMQSGLGNGDSTIPSDLQSLIGPGKIMMPEDLSKFIRQDEGLHPAQRANVLQMLNNPDIATHVLTGITGAGIALAVARWKKMSPTSQVLMSLAGFGLGNIILNKLTPPPKFTNWNSSGGTVTVL